jgi:hypothetical protein
VVRERLRMRLDEALVFLFRQGGDASGLHRNSSAAGAPITNDIDGTNGQKLRSLHRSGTMNLAMCRADRAQAEGEPFMVGPVKAVGRERPTANSLEDLVPRDHFYRHVEAMLALSFVREWMRDLYAERGRPSINPVIFIKLQLVMVSANIRARHPVPSV